MRIHCIFEEIKDRLYAVAYEDTKTNILNVLQDNWSDVTWLDEFFENNKTDLQSGFFGSISIEDAIEKTIDDADELLSALKENDGANLEELFRPLNDHEYETKEFQEQKSKRSWLRIYAVYFDDRYVITGGAIKLTRTMGERTHTKTELKKLKMVRDALKLNEADDLFVYLDI